MTCSTINRPTAPWPPSRATAPSYQNIVWQLRRVSDREPPRCWQKQRRHSRKRHCWQMNCGIPVLPMILLVRIKRGTAQQELAKELREPSSTTTKTKKEIQLLANELRDPIAIQPTYSMRSVKTSEGMKLNDFVSSFNTLSTEQYKNEQVVYFTECIVVHEADTTRIAHWLSSHPNSLVI